MSEIKPCPHCGNKNVELASAHDLGTCENFEDAKCKFCKPLEICMWTVVCPFTEGGCGASGGFRWSQDAAIEAWNEREM